MASSTRFAADYAKRVASCKKCKQKLEKDALRLAKLVPNPFSESAGEMKNYFHPDCLFETFVKARSTTKTIESSEDVEGWADLEQEDKELLLEKIDEINKKRGKGGVIDGKKKLSPSKKIPAKRSSTPSKTKPSPKKGPVAKRMEDDSSDEEEEDGLPETGNYWKGFCTLCDDVSAVSAYTQKTAAVKMYIENRHKDEEFSAENLTLLMKLLLPGVIKRVYNVNSKQLIKLYADIFDMDASEMTDHLNMCGDVSETISEFFKKNKRVKCKSNSILSLKDVDDWLDELTQYTKEDDQARHLMKIAKQCTSDDLKYIIREIKHDLRINAGAKHILDALDPDAYTAFQASRDLERVVSKVLENRGGPSGLKKALSVGIQLGVPVLPMLAEACRSVEYALKKCPHGMFAEIKYDGERVQVHKSGTQFKYFSRSLKPVQPHKIQFFEEYIPKAFPGYDENLDMILDSEVLLVDHNGKPLPFGSLGKHKKEAFKDANVALFVFDCLMFDGVSLMNETLDNRKKLLQEHMKEIPNRILLSEAEFIPKGDPHHALPRLLKRCFNEGLEGLVLKDVKSKYEPGKRHWLKVKKDYLNEGAMADSADLLVLGAYYGSGNKGGLMSVFLMGSYDKKTKQFCTVTKCGNGFDDDALDKVNKELKGSMIKISKNYDKLPGWFNCSRSLVPDFVVKDPKDAPVWEICGAEFSKSDVHTAAGISIRFPRVTRVRDDKDWDQATNVDELKALFAKSKEHADFGAEEEEVTEDSSEAEKPAVGHTALNAMLEKWEEADKSAPSTSSDVKATSPKKPKRPVAPAAKDDASDDEPPPKKAKQKCQYGAECFRKNRDHKSQFWHPGDPVSELESASDNDDHKDNQADNDDAKTIFDNHIFFIGQKCKGRDALRRYLVFYGGEITNKPDTATEILVERESDEADDLIETFGNRVIDVQWAWTCVKRKKVIPMDKYHIQDNGQE